MNKEINIAYITYKPNVLAKTPSYFEDVGFISRPNNWLSWLTFFLVFFSPSRKML